MDSLELWSVLGLHWILELTHLAIIIVSYMDWFTHTTIQASTCMYVYICYDQWYTWHCTYQQISWLCNYTYPQLSQPIQQALSLQSSTKLTSSSSTTLLHVRNLSWPWGLLLFYALMMVAKFLLCNYIMCACLYTEKFQFQAHFWGIKEHNNRWFNFQA